MRGNGMRRHLSHLARLAPVLVLALISTSGCQRSEMKRVSLLDQISEDEPAGPWRVVADFPNVGDELKSGAGITGVGLKLSDKGAVGTGGTAKLSVSLDLDGSEVLVGVVTGDMHDRSLDQRMTILLTQGSDSTQRRIRSKKRTLFRLRAVKSGPAELSLGVAIERGELLPIKSLRVLAVAPGADNRDIERAVGLNAVASLDGWGIPNWMLTFRRFPLQLHGTTRECMALVGNDTLQLNLPGSSNTLQLRYWPIVLNGRSRLRVEVGSKDHWRAVGASAEHTTGEKSWTENVLDEPRGNDYESVRFITNGGPHDILVIGEPALQWRDRTRATKNNIILIDLDTMRADRLGSYGYRTRPTSTRLDSLLDAKGFYRFQHAYSAGPHTLPATAKFMTSRYTNIHEGQTVPRQYMTLAEALRQEGFYCAAFTAGGNLRCPGFEQGFHEYHYTLRGNKMIEGVFPVVQRWLADEHPDPFFLFVHTYECHRPFTRGRFCRGLPRGRLGDLSMGQWLGLEGVSKSIALGGPGLSAAESTYVQAAYDGGVAEACDATAELLLLLERLDQMSRTIIVILSDHGEEFWEHSNNFATHLPSSVYGELLNVPFFLYSPQHRGEGMKAIDTPVSTVDLLPTVCDLLGIEIPTLCDGVSIKPLLEGGILRRALPILATNDDQRAATVRACIFQGDKKYIEPMGEGRIRDRGSPNDPYSTDPALYFLDSDPGEVENCFLESSLIAQAMSESLHAALDRVVKPFTANETAGVFSPTGELREQLRVLGYMEGS